MVPPTDSTPRDAQGAGGRRSAVGASTAVRGQIAAREDLWVDGELEGGIHAAGQQVVIGPSGRVRGEIRARAIVVEGELHGEALAEQQVAVRSGGRMTGEARAPRVGLEEGSWFQGRVDTSPRGAAATASPAAGPPATEEPAVAAVVEPPSPHAAPQLATAREPGR